MIRGVNPTCNLPLRVSANGCAWEVICELNLTDIHLRKRHQAGDWQTWLPITWTDRSRYSVLHTHSNEFVCKHVCRWCALCVSDALCGIMKSWSRPRCRWAGCQGLALHISHFADYPTRNLLACPYYRSMAALGSWLGLDEEVFVFNMSTYTKS